LRRAARPPGRAVDVFLKGKAAPLLGGEAEAREFLELAKLRSKAAEIPHALRRIYERLAKLPAPAARRWTWLAGYLSSFAYPARADL
jgi:hypothetical protein